MRPASPMVEAQKILFPRVPVNGTPSATGKQGSGKSVHELETEKKLVKLLQWEDGGFVIWMKRLEQGGFHIPPFFEMSSKDGTHDQRHSFRISRRLGTRADFDRILSN